MLTFFQRRIGAKLILFLGSSLVLSMAAFAIFNQLTVNKILESQERKATLLRELNENLRAKVFDLQGQYLAIPGRLETDPAANILKWANASFTVADKRYSGRAEFADRYKSRTVRRDIQRPGRFIVEPVEDGATISYGLFENGEFTGNVHELVLSGANADLVSAEVERIASEATNSDSLQRKVNELKADLIDEAIASETTRISLVEAAEKITAAEVEAAETVDESMVFIALLSIVTICGGITVMFFVSRRIVSRPLYDLAEAIIQVSKGNSVTIGKSGRIDEIGMLTDGILKFQSSLSEFSQVMQEQARISAEAANDKEMALRGLTDRIENELTATALAVTQETAKMDAIAGRIDSEVQATGINAEAALESAEASLELSRSVAAAAGALLQSIREVSDATVNARQTSGKATAHAVTASSLFDDVSKAGEQISHIVHLIGAIAKQTNMLALNATIEAQRAGENGKGFAVVATEVKSLANQTQQAAAEISDLMENITFATGSAKTAVEQLASTIDEVGDANREILTISDKQQQMTRSISGDIEEATSMSVSVVEAFRKVQNSTVGLGRVSRELAGASGDVNSRIGNLQAAITEIAGSGIANATRENSGSAGSRNNEDLNAIQLRAA